MEFFERLGFIPPGLSMPPAMPEQSGDILGALRGMIADPIGFAVKAMQVGDVVSARALHRHIYMVSHPEPAYRVLVGNQANYSKGSRDYDKLSLILGRGLLTSDGAHWKRQRRIAQPAFRRKTVSRLAGVVADAARDLADDWSAQLARAPRRDVSDGEPYIVVDVAQAMTALTLRLAAETLFGVDLTQRTQVVGEALTAALRHIDWLIGTPIPYPELWPTPANRRFWEAAGTLDRVVREVIDERRARARGGEQRHDLLGMLMAAQDPETGEGMTDDQLRDEVLTMMLAGHETTANALNWTFYLMSQHADVDARVAGEIAASGAVDDAERGPDGAPDIRRLDYTRRALDESMRLFPPVWMVARRAESRDKLGGYDVAAGAYVYVSFYGIHRHPALWADPERFDADRFLPERVAARPKLSYLPFAQGPRKCIGDHFARMEALTIMAELLSRFQLTLEPGFVVEPDPAITLRPRHGLRMRVRVRR